MKIKPNAWNGWDPLKVVMLGTCVNNNFFSTIKDTKLRDSLTRVIEETNEDLENFKNELIKQGVAVVDAKNEPFFKETFHETIEWFRNDEWANEQDELRYTGMFKPNLSPRDYLITMGERVLLTTKNNKLSKLMSELFDDEDIFYLKDSNARFQKLHEKFKNSGTHLEWHHGFGAPSITRVGKNVIVDTEDYGYVKEFLEEEFPNFDYTEIKEGGHTDGVFCTVKPGHIISVVDESMEQLYKKTFPNWDVHFIRNAEKSPARLGQWKQEFTFEDKRQWWTDDMNENPALLSFVDEWLNEWVGYCEESVFEVNMLSLSENKIMGSTWNKDCVNYLDKHGVEFIHVPFRHRRFWDGGLHCLTVDLVREGQQRQYEM